MMLKTTFDFRLGNWVYDFAKNPVQITDLTKPGAIVLQTPIPIDDYWLGRMGFQMDEGVPHLIWQRDYGWQGIYYSKPWIILTKGDVNGDRMQLGEYFYVHEIQNLYFGIRNKELIFDAQFQPGGDRTDEWRELQKSISATAT